MQRLRTLGFAGLSAEAGGARRIMPDAQARARRSVNGYGCADDSVEVACAKAEQQVALDILLVEDHLINQKLIVLLLER